MKIIVHDYAGHPFQIQLSKELARRGYKTLHLYSASIQTPRGNLTKGKDDPSNFFIKGLKLDKDIEKYSFIKRYFQEKKYAKLLIDEIKEFNPDIIVSSNTPVNIQHELVKYSKNKNIGFIYWVQDIYGVAVEKILSKKFGFIGKIIGIYFEHLEKKSLADSNKIILISEDFEDIMYKYGINCKNCEVIYNWAPIDEIKIYDKVNEWSKNKGLSNTFNFLYSGTLGLKHNPQLLIDLALYFKDKKDVRVVVISEGIGADFLKKEKEKYNLKNLLIFDFLPFKELPKALSSADVLVAILEPDAGIFSVPSKVLTYHCIGRPILLSVPKENLASRIVNRFKTGISVEPFNTEAFLKAAEQLYNNPDLRKSLGNNARIYAEKNFDIKRIGDKFEDLIKDIQKGG